MEGVYMSFDAISYAMGSVAGRGAVVLDGDGYVFTDDGDGNVVMSEAETETEEATDNG